MYLADLAKRKYVLLILLPYFIAAAAFSFVHTCNSDRESVTCHLEDDCSSAGLAGQLLSAQHNDYHKKHECPACAIVRTSAAEAGPAFALISSEVITSFVSEEIIPLCSSHIRLQSPRAPPIC